SLVLGSEERVEDMIELGCRYACSSVGYLNLIDGDVVSSHGSSDDSDFTIRRRSLDGIQDEVYEHLFDLIAIGANGGECRRECPVERELMLPSLGLHKRYDAIGRFV